MQIYKPPTYKRDSPILIFYRGSPVKDQSSYGFGTGGMNGFITRHGMMIVAPWHDDTWWPQGQWANRGGVTVDETADGIDNGVEVPKARMLLASTSYIVQEIYHLEDIYPSDNRRFIIAGQSAGAEFVNRLAAFFEHNNTRFVVINGVQLMFPKQDMAWGWGLKNLSTILSGNAALQNWLKRDMTIFSGSLDAEGDGFTGAEYLAQGANSYERHNNMFLAGQSRATTEGWAFGWRWVPAVGAGHGEAVMMNHANADSAFFGVG